MARFIYNNRIYDADKSEEVFAYSMGDIDVTLFRTAAGEWFYYAFGGRMLDRRILDGKYVKQILLNRNRQDLVDMYFNEHAVITIS